MLRALVAIVAMPQAKLESSRKPVSSATDPQVEELPRARAARRRMRQHRIGGKEAGEQDEVGEQEDPEAVAGDDALGRRALVAAIGLGACAELVRIVDGGREYLTGVMPGSRPSTSAMRACAALARRSAASSAAGNSYSASSRQAKTTKVAKAPTRPTTTIHQMCQISAKPVTTAKKAVDETRRAVARHLDRLVVGQRR